MTPPRPRTDFARNDLAAALAAWEANRAQPVPDTSLNQFLVMMFDDPDEYLAEVQRRIAADRATAA